MRGKIVALELLKILLKNAGAVFRTSERYLVSVFRILHLLISSLFLLSDIWMFVFQHLVEVITHIPIVIIQVMHLDLGAFVCGNSLISNHRRVQLAL